MGGVTDGEGDMAHKRGGPRADGRNDMNSLNPSEYHDNAEINVNMVVLFLVKRHNFLLGRSSELR